MSSLSEQPTNRVSTPECLRVLERFGRIGYWHADLRTDEIYWSDQACGILGLSPDGHPDNLEDAITLFHPDDHEHIRLALSEATKSGASFHIKVRLKPDPETLLWIEIAGEVQSDETDDRTAVIGTLRDVTHEINISIQLKGAAEFHRRITAAINEMPDAFVIFDNEDKLFLCNEAYKKLYTETTPILEPGVLFEDMIRYGLDHGQYPDAIGREDEWLEERMRMHQNPPGPIEQRLADGRWSRVQEYITSDGSRVGARIDISEMKHLEQQLIETATQANSANRLKDRFLANMSHELRTPLNAIIGFSQVIEMMMAQEDCDRAKVSEYATDISGAGLHLLGIIEDIFSLAQMEAEETNLNLAPLDVHTLLDDAISLTGRLAREYGRTICLEKNQCGDLQLIADKTKLTQVLVNLISNAIKYSGDGEIILRSEIGMGDHILLKVIDKGPGIPPHQQEQIFERFERLNATEQAIEGVGIGLAIARDLVQSMSGEIGVNSSVGQGSTFWISLPQADKNRQRLAG